MFNTISWNLFFTTVILLASAYYLITFLLLYHNDITNWRKSKSERSSESKQLQETTDLNVMGPFDERDKSIKKNLASLSPEASSADVLIGTVSDLLQEIKSLIKLTNENAWEQNQFESLFRRLLVRFPTLVNTPHQQSVSAFIADTAADEFSFDFKVDEIMTWWE